LGEFSLSWGVRLKLRVLYANSLEISHTKEAFLLVFRFQAPDGFQEAVYVSLSPAGASILEDMLGKELKSYIEKFGNITVEWTAPQNANSNVKQSNQAGYSV